MPKVVQIWDIAGMAVLPIHLHADFNFCQVLIVLSFFPASAFYSSFLQHFLVLELQLISLDS